MSEPESPATFTGSTTVERDGFSITSTDSEASILEVLDRENPEGSTDHVERVDADAGGETAVVADPDDSSGTSEERDDPGTTSPPDRARADRPRDDTGKFKKLTGKARQQQIQADIDRATYLRHEEERQLEELRLERARLEADIERSRQPKPAAANGESRPDWYKDFEVYRAANPSGDYEAWSDAKADWREERLQQKWQAAQQTLSVQQQAQQQAQQAWDAHFARVAAARKPDPVTGRAKYPDWEDVSQRATAALRADGLPEIPPVIMRAFLDSERGDDILYYLGTHPEELIRLARENLRTPVEAAPLMRQLLEARLVASSASGPARTPVSSSAAPPIKPLGSAPVIASDDVDDLPFNHEYLRRLKLEDQKRGRR